MQKQGMDAVLFQISWSALQKFIPKYPFFIKIDNFVKNKISKAIDFPPTKNIFPPELSSIKISWDIALKLQSESI